MIRASCSTMFASSGVGGGASSVADGGIYTGVCTGSLAGVGMEAGAAVVVAVGFGGELGFGISGILSATLAVVSTCIGLGTRFSVGAGVSFGGVNTVFADSGAGVDFGGAAPVFVGAGVVAMTETGVFGVDDGIPSGV